MFPNDEEVKAATKNPKEPTSKETLAKCKALFWFQPATTLRGLLPGVLDVWDAAYSKCLPTFEGTAFCDPQDQEWRKAWTQYSNAVIEGMVDVSQASTYIKLPDRAIARLRYFMVFMMAYHTKAPFPTKSFISHISKTFDKFREALCDVSIIFYNIALSIRNQPRDMYRGVRYWCPAIKNVWSLSLRVYSRCPAIKNVWSLPLRVYSWCPAIKNVCSLSLRVFPVSSDKERLVFIAECMFLVSSDKH